MYPALIEAAVQDQQQQRIARARAARIVRAASARHAEQTPAGRPVLPAALHGGAVGSVACAPALLQASRSASGAHPVLTHPVHSFYRWLAAGQL